MSKKEEAFYYDNFVESISISCEAAALLKNILINFNEDDMFRTMEMMHKIENKGDQKRHEMMSVLVKAFITPIERNDIIALSQNIDRVTDSIEDIVIQLYINNISTIRSDSIAYMDIIMKCCNRTKDLLEEFRHFKKSKILRDIIIEINHLEEDGDKMYIKTMKKLHANNNNILSVIAWREIYSYFEKCCDACEDVADIVEGIVIDNV